MPLDPDPVPDIPDPVPSEEFARDLGAAFRKPVSVPGSRDDAILRHARDHFTRLRWRQRAYRIGALASAAAALVAIVLHLYQPAQAPSPLAINSVQTTGAVDIVDALKLARRIRSDQTDPTRDDFNHDGAVDQQDVDAIAMAAVKLPEARVQ